ncbi:MAG: hypothetical protein PHS97_02580 [Oscillospiraceae bacterium]|nr:hypothetical protein [Oscillospiraceae bacterium]
MKIASFITTMSLGMAAGAAVSMMLPRQSQHQLRQMAGRAADVMEDVVDRTCDRCSH